MDKKKGKLLIADDESNIRLLIKKIFEKEYTVIEAENGKRAVDSAIHNAPDIILMDIMMPELDGLTALSAMK
ncbi:MAG: Response regulator containing a CheY-like receiver domain, partial [Deltaproteobacteria bacterium]|nr:Response regulator containing a CheY-like receiver domain [Deltaproteobacteria bacterium]